MPLGQEFTLAPGQAASLEGTSVRLQFRDVTGDSRCPADVVCIQGGDAIVHVVVIENRSSSPYELHTGDSARAVVVHGPFHIALTGLQPYPFSTRTIADGEYRATFRVTRT